MRNSLFCFLFLPVFLFSKPIEVVVEWGLPRQESTSLEAQGEEWVLFMIPIESCRSEEPFADMVDLDIYLEFKEVDGEGIKRLKAFFQFFLYSQMQRKCLAFAIPKPFFQIYHLDSQPLSSVLLLSHPKLSFGKMPGYLHFRKSRPKSEEVYLKRFIDADDRLLVPLQEVGGEKVGLDGDLIYLQSRRED